MKLFAITDEGETVYVAATDHVDALDHWKPVMADRLGCDMTEIDGPQSVSLIASGDEIVLTPSVAELVSAEHVRETFGAEKRECRTCGWLTESGGCLRSAGGICPDNYYSDWKPREEKK